ncbi:MAG: hypothetical protein ABI355_03755 [Solirubrobacteraceae bacterium]
MPPQEHQRRPEQAHDVLAAEEFGMPAADPILHHHEPVTLPSDPTGIVEAHDVLAAEEFAMPAGRPTASGLPTAGGSDAGRGRMLAVAGALGLLALGRSRARRRRA